MRLLDTTTGRFRTFNSPLDVRYAILSHVWDKPGKKDGKVVHPSGEQTYQELLAIQALVPAPHIILDHDHVSSKIRGACEVARTYGYYYLWIDACCINKESSAELTEAINSMYEWYTHASVCYAFLADVDDDSEPRPNLFEVRFRNSKWHTRGWTLQELIAPRSLIFFSSQWTILGTKRTLETLVEDATGVDGDVLTHAKPLATVSVARRMWWASRRTTTRVEDEAYSLMGLFGVNMPTIYGEGRRAFLRLQEEILRRIPDDSIFAWDLHPYPGFHHGTTAETDQKIARDATLPLFDPNASSSPWDMQEVNGMFAHAPRAFSFSEHIRSIPHQTFVARIFATNIPLSVPPSSYSTTPYGIRAKMCGRRTLLGSGVSGLLGRCGYVVLECEDKEGSLVALLFNYEGVSKYVGSSQEPITSDSVPETIGAPISGTRWARENVSFGVRLVSLSAKDIEHDRRFINAIEVLFPLQPSTTVGADDADNSNVPPGLSWELAPHSWCQSLLVPHGYALRRLQRHILIKNHLNQYTFALEPFADEDDLQCIIICIALPYGVYAEAVEENLLRWTVEEVWDSIPTVDSDRWKSFASKRSMEVRFSIPRAWPRSMLTMHVSVENPTGRDAGVAPPGSEPKVDRGPPQGSPDFWLGIELHESSLVLS
ncbi:heterokaryon incompatibility protein-domain-containing protein [Trametes meyenii]|nr:heterokaryon incompatibility protein-domain-containing protein [Trametes meyenii]